MVRAVSGLVAVAMLCAGLAYAVASFGSEGLIGVAGICLLLVSGWLLWPLIRDLLTTEPVDIPTRPARTRRVTVAAPRRRMVSAVGIGAVVVGSRCSRS